ncbi:MAG: NUDIX domain-containing protein [Candidatus Paceibacterota bacterium]
MNRKMDGALLIAQPREKGSRCSYGLLIVVKDKQLGPSVLCVQQHISYSFRELMYKLACLNRFISAPMHLAVASKGHRSEEKLRIVEAAVPSSSLPPQCSPVEEKTTTTTTNPRYSLGMPSLAKPAAATMIDAIGEINSLVSKLSPREYGILRNAEQFEAEVRRAYTGERKRHIMRVLHAYGAIKHSFAQLKPDLKAKERRWSPPKGGACTDGRIETELDVVMRETWEETGLRVDQYRIIDPHRPVTCDYDVNGNHMRVVLYVGQLVEHIPFPPFNEGNAPPSVPKPVMKDEISRTGLMPIHLLDEYLPEQYGKKVKEALLRRLMEERRSSTVEERRSPGELFMTLAAGGGAVTPSAGVVSTPPQPERTSPPDTWVMSTAIKSPSMTTLDADSVMCSVRRSSDGVPVMHFMTSPILRHHDDVRLTSPPLCWADIPTPQSSDDDEAPAPSASS